MSTGGGADLFNVAPTTDTGLALGFVAGAAVAANGAVLNVTGMDKITGFGTTAGATIQLTGLTTASTILRNGQTLGADNAGNIALLVGTYSSAAGTFTVDISGTSSLFVYDDNGTGTGGSYRGIVLVGYVDLAGNDTMATTGLLTGVGG